MPFRISLAHELFQSKLHECLADLHGVKVIRDDILVIGYGETDEKPLMDHDRNVIRLLERVLKAREPDAQLFERQAEANRGQVYGPCKGSGIPTSLLPPRTCPNLHLNLNNPRWLAKTERHSARQRQRKKKTRIIIPRIPDLKLCKGYIQATKVWKFVFEKHSFLAKHEC